MSETPINEILCTILEMMKAQALYLRRQHGWLIAVAETIESNPEMCVRLKQHPFYDQGLAPELRSIGETHQHIDGLIQKLKGQ